MITDKDSLYEAFQRNGYCMPKKSEAFVTIKFLLGARDDRYFLPKTDMVTHK